MGALTSGQSNQSLCHGTKCNYSICLRNLGYCLWQLMPFVIIIVNIVIIICGSIIRTITFDFGLIVLYVFNQLLVYAGFHSSNSFSCLVA